MGAAIGGKTDTLKYLISIDSNLKNHKDNYNASALNFAAEYADKATVKFLVETLRMDTKNVARKGRTPFLYAVLKGKIETVKYLDSIDSDLKNARDTYGGSALTVAAEYANKATVKFL